MDSRSTKRGKNSSDILFCMLMAVALLLAIFAVILQGDASLFSGLWKIQTGHAGLITDPMCTGGAGAALLNAALMLLGSTLLVRLQRMPFTGLSVACMNMMAGFALLGKNMINSAPIVAGSFLFALYKREKFSKYVYLSLFGTCLSPMVSYFMLHFSGPWRFALTIGVGLVIGFVMPAVAGHTVRLHQGYNLYNVGVSAGFVGLALVSIFKGFGVVFETETTWSSEYNLPLCLMMLALLLGLFIAGIALGCRSWKQYRRLLSHSGRAVTDFFAMEGLGVSFVNMALVGAIGLLYLMLVRAPLNGPLVCCLFTMIGFGCFGKHIKNVVPVMAGAILAAVLMKNVALTSPGVLLATLLCTGLAPIAGKFGWAWGIAAGFVHMSIVQNTAYLHAGLNLYNNGFAAGLTCIIMIPLIEALKREPEE